MRNFMFPGLLDGEHFFTLMPLIAGGGTRLVHGARFTGVLVPLLWNPVDPTITSGFEAMNRALKQWVEQPI